MSLWPCVPKPAPGATRSSFKTRKDRKPMCPGSSYSPKENVCRLSSQSQRVWPRSSARRIWIIVSGSVDDRDRLDLDEQVRIRERLDADERARWRRHVLQYLRSHLAQDRQLIRLEADDIRVPLHDVLERGSRAREGEAQVLERLTHLGSKVSFADDFALRVEGHLPRDVDRVASAHGDGVAIAPRHREALWILVLLHNAAPFCLPENGHRR